MGLLKYLQSIRESKKDSKMLILGLDNSGKTTILKKVCNKDIQNIAPTEGFNVKKLDINGLKITVWDLGG